MTLSVVVASCRGPALLSQTVESLLSQCREVDAELIVARRMTGPAGASEPTLEGCVVVDCAADATIPELRGAGLATATGDRVLVTEDNCVARPGWVHRLNQGFDAGADVVGGAIDNAHPRRPVDAAAYFVEYGFFGPSQTEIGASASPFVSGANVGYRSPWIRDAAAWALAGEWEGVIHHRLLAQGARFLRVDGAVVAQNLHYRVVDFGRDRFEHGREYGFTRRRAWGWGKRLIMAGATALLPPLMAWRAWRGAGRGARINFLKALPLTLGFATAWAVGEAAGYLTARRP